jgi:hypothetical protein
MKWIIAAASLLAVLLPCALLLPLKWGFACDWANHLWEIAYFGDYYRAHHHMPLVLSTSQIAGDPAPIFYGYLFYPILGWLSRWVGPDGAVRLAAFGTLGVQFVLVRRVLRVLGTSRGIALTAACLVTWATYPLTNLYNRAALPEFFAAAWLTCATCHWFFFLRAGATRPMVAHALGIALLVVLAAGTHPITAFMGGCLSVPLAAAGLLAIRGDGLRRRLALLGLAGLVAALCLAPWLYATALFQGRLVISAGRATITAFPGLDEWHVRFFPLPLDARTVLHDPAQVGTPYLDAQANVALLVLAVACLVKVLAPAARRAGALVWAPLVLVAAHVGCCTILSLYPDVQFQYLPRPFTTVQYTYRWVNQINLGLLALLCVGLLARARGGLPVPPARLGGAFLGCLLTWAGAGVLVKLEHAYYVHETFYTKLPSPPEGQLAPTYYGMNAYSTPSEYAPLGPCDRVLRADLRVNPAVEYGTPRPRRVVADRAGVVITSVQAFPWNRVYVDGREVPREHVRLAQTTDSVLGSGAIPRVLLAVPVQPGEHVLEYRLRPNRVWAVLARLAWWSLAALVVACAVAWGGPLAVAALRRRPGQRLAVGPSQGRGPACPARGTVLYPAPDGIVVREHGLRWRNAAGPAGSADSPFDQS